MTLKAPPSTDAAQRFTAQWREVFDQIPPLGDLLRHAYDERWTRFHALPASKRYPSVPSEYEEICMRGHALLEACFPDEHDVWVSTVRYDQCEANPSDMVQELGMDFAFSWVDDTLPPEDQCKMRFYCCRPTRAERSFDAIFTAVANEEGEVVFFSEQSGVVFAPYDGGFDLICRDAQQMGELERRFAEWMSGREDKR